MWIVEVGGRRLFFGAMTARPSVGAPAPIEAEYRKVEREIATIVRSIRVD